MREAVEALGIMNAQDQARLAGALGEALQQANLLIERADQVDGRLRWSPVAAAMILGTMLRLGWRVSIREGAPVRELPLQLVGADAPLAVKGRSPLAQRPRPLEDPYAGPGPAIPDATGHP